MHRGTASPRPRRALALGAAGPVRVAGVEDGRPHQAFKGRLTQRHRDSAGYFDSLVVLISNDAVLIDPGEGTR